MDKQPHRISFHVSLLKAPPRNTTIRVAIEELRLCRREVVLYLHNVCEGNILNNYTGRPPTRLTSTAAFERHETCHRVRLLAYRLKQEVACFIGILQHKPDRPNLIGGLSRSRNKSEITSLEL
jgi:hypothetical protein